MLIAFSILYPAFWLLGICQNGGCVDRNHILEARLKLPTMRKIMRSIENLTQINFLYIPYLVLLIIYEGALQIMQP